ncbi:hypothetical protein K439DRAFT_1410214 [Ramaria rubella]|nr:hypothetical protein K439DRAFT_1410214 [Ramaria rubella]
MEDPVMAEEQRQEEARRHKEELKAKARRAREEARRRAEAEARRRAQEDAQKCAEEEVRAAEERLARERARERKARATAERRHLAFVARWNDYETRWQTLYAASPESLTFASIPWPVVARIATPEHLLPKLIADFLLSPEHSHTKSPRHRIHAALLRWHTDHFDAKLMNKVIMSERKLVQDGVGRVVRCLNDMLADTSRLRARD